MIVRRTSRAATLVACAAALGACSSTNNLSDASDESEVPDASGTAGNDVVVPVDRVVPVDVLAVPDVIVRDAVVEAAAPDVIVIGLDAPVEASRPDVTVIGLDAPVEASAPDVVEASVDGGLAGLVCPAIFVSTDGGTGDGGADAEAGTLVSRWRNYGTNSCGLCPAPEVTCESFTDSSFTYSQSTGIATITLPPGTAEITAVTGTVNLYVRNGEGQRYTQVDLAFTIDGDTITTDLRSVIPADVVELQSININLVDACGTNSDRSLSAHFQDGPSTPVTISCEF